MSGHDLKKLNKPPPPPYINQPSNKRHPTSPKFELRANSAFRVKKPLRHLGSLNQQ